MLTRDNVLCCKGAGLLGVYGAVILRELGISSNIFCCDVDAKRLKMIEEFGAQPIQSLK